MANVSVPSAVRRLAISTLLTAAAWHRLARHAYLPSGPLPPNINYWSILRPKVWTNWFILVCLPAQSPTEIEQCAVSGRRPRFGVLAPPVGGLIGSVSLIIWPRCVNGRPTSDGQVINHVDVGMTVSRYALSASAAYWLRLSTIVIWTIAIMAVIVATSQTPTASIRRTKYSWRLLSTEDNSLAAICIRQAKNNCKRTTNTKEKIITFVSFALSLSFPGLVRQLLPGFTFYLCASRDTLIFWNQLIIFRFRTYLSRIYLSVASKIGFFRCFAFSRTLSKSALLDVLCMKQRIDPERECD